MDGSNSEHSGPWDLFGAMERNDGRDIFIVIANSNRDIVSRGCWVKMSINGAAHSATAIFLCVERIGDEDYAFVCNPQTSVVKKLPLGLVSFSLDPRGATDVERWTAQQQFESYFLGSSRSSRREPAKSAGGAEKRAEAETTGDGAPPTVKIRMKGQQPKKKEAPPCFATLAKDRSLSRTKLRSLGAAFLQSFAEYLKIDKNQNRDVLIPLIMKKLNIKLQPAPPFRKESEPSRSSSRNSVASSSSEASTLTSVSSSSSPRRRNQKEKRPLRSSNSNESDEEVNSAAEVAVKAKSPRVDDASDEEKDEAKVDAELKAALKAALKKATQARILQKHPPASASRATGE
jgi:hypothetical protein